MHLPNIKLVEVGPRDGLQNESLSIPTRVKLVFIQHLIASGLKHIEVTSFVSPKWVPQLADHKDIMEELLKHPDWINSIDFSALVPNQMGFETALSAGCNHIAVFTAASESFCQKNINCSIAESFERFEPIMRTAQMRNIRVRGYISCAIACPYEGAIDPGAVAAVAAQLHQIGCAEISLGDTIGTGTPKQIHALLDAVKAHVPLEKLALHCHDTYGQALANIYAGLEDGIRIFDSSVAGLGGCPYARGATGNVATEDVVYLLEGLGVETGVDLKKLVIAGNYISHFLNRPSRSRVALALSASTSNKE